jgi:hypothetical protein
VAEISPVQEIPLSQVTEMLFCCGTVASSKGHLKTPKNNPDAQVLVLLVGRAAHAHVMHSVEGAPDLPVIACKLQSRAPCEVSN